MAKILNEALLFKLSPAGAACSMAVNASAE
jgi:hypothetical protein